MAGGFITFLTLCSIGVFIYCFLANKKGRHPALYEDGDQSFWFRILSPLAQIALISWLFYLLIIRLILGWYFMGFVTPYCFSTVCFILMDLFFVGTSINAKQKKLPSILLKTSFRRAKEIYTILRGIYLTIFLFVSLWLSLLSSMDLGIMNLITIGYGCSPSNPIGKNEAKDVSINGYYEIHAPNNCIPTEFSINLPGFNELGFTPLKYDFYLFERKFFIFKKFTNKKIILNALNHRHGLYFISVKPFESSYEQMTGPLGKYMDKVVLRNETIGDSKIPQGRSLQSNELYQKDSLIDRQSGNYRLLQFDSGTFRVIEVF